MYILRQVAVVKYTSCKICMHLVCCNAGGVFAIVVQWKAIHRVVSHQLQPFLYCKQDVTVCMQALLLMVHASFYQLYTKVILLTL